MTQKEQFINILKAQKGYKAAASGWTKYGQWYADNIAKHQAFACAPWCAMTLTWCAHQAGIPGDIMPQTSPAGSSCPTMLKWYEDRGCRYDGNTMPEAGDPVFFDWDADGKPDHVGLIIHVDGTTPDNAVLHTIEGNLSRNDGEMVDGRIIKYRDRKVLATVRPNYDTTDDPDPATVYVRKGDKGDAVLMLQWALFWEGEDLLRDGDYGDETDYAVKSFQKKHSLEVDGIVGPITWRTLTD